MSTSTNETTNREHPVVALARFKSNSAKAILDHVKLEVEMYKILRVSASPNLLVHIDEAYTNSAKRAIAKMAALW
jgi:hypothetical protein